MLCRVTVARWVLQVSKWRSLVARTWGGRGLGGRNVERLERLRSQAGGAAPKSTFHERLRAARSKSVFVTGHTGFKGSWLSLWLARLGAQVTGYSLDAPSEPNNFAISGVEPYCTTTDTATSAIPTD